MNVAMLLANKSESQGLVLCASTKLAAQLSGSYATCLPSFLNGDQDLEFMVDLKGSGKYLDVIQIYCLSSDQI